MEIIAIDDNLDEDAPIIVELGILYGDQNIKLFSRSNDGLDYIKKNLHKKLIVILDINFPADEKNGHEVLEEIRKYDKLIPVIIWSAMDGSTDNFTDFINNHALFYVNQTEEYAVIIDKVKEAEHRLNLDVATAIENWLYKQDNKDKTIMISGDNESYTANDLINAIRMQTEKGRKLEENILKLTISLLFRGKEKI